MTKAIFTGSFDPFTVGHASIVQRALPLFDSIVIAVGHNEHKKGMFSVEERVERIEKHYANEPKIEVVAYSDLTVDVAKRVGANVIIKGVRSFKDFEYERQQAEINKNNRRHRNALFMLGSTIRKHLFEHCSRTYSLR